MEEEKKKKTVDISRILSAAIGFPIVAVLMIFGNNYVIDIALAIVGIQAMREYLNAVSKKSNPVKWISYLSCVIIAIMHIIPTEYVGLVQFLSIPVLIALLFFQVIVTNMKTNFNDITYTFIGICYIVFCVLSMSLIRGMENGVLLIWYLILAGWGTDVFAYLIGKYFGKHKFSDVSPKKSIEGCIAGTVGAIILTVVYTYLINKYTDLNYSYWLTAIIGLILSILGQLGDFAASAIKRYVGVKDYSNIIPGHGGMMDRIDSLLFIGPFAYILLGLL
ncbi:MAG: phosphatidate cytidylyltransferase [Clostridia bacterium]|nr:phosphatidate cytidylyltransferase [Clostridia bacterium]